MLGDDFGTRAQAAPEPPVELKVWLLRRPDQGSGMRDVITNEGHEPVWQRCELGQSPAVREGISRIFPPVMLAAYCSKPRTASSKGSLP